MNLLLMLLPRVDNSGMSTPTFWRKDPDLKHLHFVVKVNESEM